MGLPANVGFGRVTGRLIRAILDGPIDPDTEPDGVPIEGAKVTFTASVNRIVNRTATPPVSIFIDPVTVVTNGDGILVSPDGTEGVTLVASDDADLDPSGWTYKVTMTAPSISTLSWSITVPEGSVQDLATAIPVPANPGTGVAEWQGAVDAVWQARDVSTAEVLQARDVSVDAVEQAAEVGQYLLDQRGNVSGTLDLSGVSRNLIVHATMTGNLTVTLPSSPMIGHTITLELLQDATGSRLLTVQGAVTAYGVGITPAPAANALTEVMCLWDGIRWHARVSGLADSKPTGW